MASEPPVLLDATREGIAVVTLNRPDLHNAFNAEVIALLADIFDDLADQDGVRAVMIAAEGPSFSAGADLTWMKAAADYTESENREDAEALARMLRLLRDLPQPSIALVHGPAIAGGMGIVAACDIAIATEAAFFGLSEVRLGLIPAVISPYVVEAIGPRAARRYFLTGERIDSAEAFRLGLVHRVVADKAALGEAAESIVGAILQGAPGAITEAKRLIEDVAWLPVEESLMAETARRIAARRASAEGREGLSAFLAKRDPSWRQG